MAYLRPFSIYMMSCNLLHYNDALLSLSCPPFGRTEPIIIGDTIRRFWVNGLLVIRFMKCMT